MTTLPEFLSNSLLRFTFTVTFILNPNYYNNLFQLITQYIQGVPGGIVNILGFGSMDYSEYISSYKQVSKF